MKIDRAETLKALNAVQVALAQKEVVDQSQSFVFKDGKVMTYNDELAAIVPLEWPADGAVRASLLLGFLTKQNAETLGVSVKGNELRFKSKKSCAGIALETDIRLPISDIGEPKKWRLLPKDFSTALRFCLFSASRDVSYAELTCLHCFDTTVEACDGYRCTRYKLEGDKRFAEELLVPRRAALRVCKVDPVKYARTEGWLHFATKDGLRYACRTYVGEFPELDEHLNVKGAKVTMPDDVEGMVERARDFAESDDEIGHLVDVVLTNGRLEIDGAGVAGWFKEHTSIEYEGESVRFTVSASFLAETLSLLRDITIGSEKLKLRGERFEHVVKLVLEDEDDGGD